VVTGEKNSPTVAHVCRKRRLNRYSPGWGLEHRASNPVSVKKFNCYRNLNNCKVVEALCSSGNEED
jgi:hypothetical protein